VERASRHPFARLLRAFERLTGCPVLLNTSFNMSDEPLVCTIDDALVCFLRSEIDVLVLDSFMIERIAVPSSLIDVVRRAFVAKPAGVSEHVYTLV
jgi:carbamoyltransferase